MTKDNKNLKNSQINTPHDMLFKKSMQVPQVAKEFLMMHLPSEYKNHIDYKTLELLPETFINEQLKRSQVDALFKVQYENKDLLIYILIEQQSNPDKSMPTRRLSYKSDIWSSYIKTNKSVDNQKLPPIIDLHFFTGPKPYDGPLSLADLAGENTDLVHECLIQPMINIWAGDITEEQLKTHPWAATLEYIMINRRNKDLRNVLKTIAPNIRFFYMEKQNQFVLSLYTYIENVYTFEASVEVLARIASEEISPQAGEDIMTIAEQMKHKGIEQGIEQGILTVAKNMIKEGVDPVFISKITGLSTEQIKQLKQQ